MSATDPTSFYDSLAGDYHLMFPNWWAHATWQGGVLDRLLRDRGVQPSRPRRTTGGDH